MIGKVLGAIAKPFGEVAGKVVGAWSANKEGERNIVALKIQNKAAELKAASELKIAEFRAKTKRAENRDAQSFTLDELAVKESQGTYWDEFLSFSFLLSFFYWPLFVGPLVISMMTGVPLPDPASVYEAMKAVPTVVWCITIAIHARYLGMRGWFRDMKINKQFEKITGKKDIKESK